MQTSYIEGRPEWDELIREAETGRHPMAGATLSLAERGLTRAVEQCLGVKDWWINERARAEVYRLMDKWAPQLQQLYDEGAPYEQIESMANEAVTEAGRCGGFGPNAPHRQLDPGVTGSPADTGEKPPFPQYRNGGTSYYSQELEQAVEGKIERAVTRLKQKGVATPHNVESLARPLFRHAARPVRFSLNDGAYNEAYNTLVAFLDSRQRAIVEEDDIGLVPNPIGYGSGAGPSTFSDDALASRIISRMPKFRGDGGMEDIE